MKVKAMTDLGKVRKNNEDNFFVDLEGGLFMVADGMGGHRGGEVASEMAVKIISEHIKQNLPLDALKEDIFKVLEEAIIRANKEIKEKADKNNALKGMGTTVIVALIRGEKLYLSHVGDSRAYIIREEKITQLTEDHSIVMQMVKAKMITLDEAKRHPLKHMLSQAVGTSAHLVLDSKEIEFKKGDYLLLCTDGLTDMVTDEEILSIVLKNGDDVEKACQELVDIANKNGGKDNITVILLYNS